MKLWENQKPELDPEYTFPCKTIEENGCYLKLQKVTMKDDAKYESVVQTADDKTTSTKFMLKILKAIAEIILPEDGEVCYGGKASISVTFRTNSPVQRIEWMKAFQDNFTTINILRDKYNQSGYDSSGAVLLVHDCDVLDDAYYRITVYNGFGKSTSRNMHLRVLDAPPSVILSISETPILQETARIFARIHANRPLSKITWHKYLQGVCKITESMSRDCQTYYSTTEEYEEYLLIRKVNINDQGLFHVEVSHYTGKVQSNTIRFVLENVPPFIAGITGPTLLDERNSECAVYFVSFHPLTSITWKYIGKHEEKEICPLDKRYKISTDYSTYSKLIVSEECYVDNAQYLCEVANSVGTTKSDTVHISYETYLQLEIEDPSKNFKAGETAVLIATMNSAPNTTKLWTKSSKDNKTEKKLPVLSGYSGKYKGSTSDDKMSALCINFLNSDDEGFYQLTVSKKSGHCAKSKKVWLGIEKKVSVDEVKMKKGNTFGDCQICFDKENEVVLNPCGHMCCQNCASNLNLCPFCREGLKGRIKVYKS
ncbi:uncharacterized protein LOC134255334 [Saccostrea cucullata]|uniref:uncharacterized protein LOC134255334 n=1 Tax=Saccostrea cuccullata TaxID=36930 RepID=UPI002ED635D4